MQATLFWACAVAPKHLRRFAHAQNDLIWTVTDATELDLAAAPNGGSRALAATSGCHGACSRRAAPVSLADVAGSAPLSRWRYRVVRQ